MAIEQNAYEVIEDVTSRATINFQKPLDSQHVEDLLHYITSKLPGTISYNIETNKRLGQDVEKSLGSVKITGDIKASNPISSSSFSTLYCEDPTYIGGIKFGTIPGYELSEHRKDQVELWDKVRSLVQDYFED